MIVFIVFGGICLTAAVNLLVQRHPINSALSLIVVMAALAVLYLLLGAEFVAAIQVIVYAGAIMVLFVFVIMLLNAGVEEHTFGSHVALRFGFPGVVILAGLVIYSLMNRQSATETVTVGAMYGPPVEIGRLLFHDFLLPFEVTSVLILIAIMGAVVLARNLDTMPGTATTGRTPQSEPATESRAEEGDMAVAHDGRVR